MKENKSLKPEFVLPAPEWTALSAQLAASLAHEIRNPLLSIKGAAQLLEQSASDEDKTLAQLIINEAKRIEQLVATLERANAQIRYFRRVDQESPERRERTYREHGDVLDCLARRDARRAGELIERHIVLSRERALAVTEQVVARLAG